MDQWVAEGEEFLNPRGILHWHERLLGQFGELSVSCCSVDIAHVDSRQVD